MEIFVEYILCYSTAFFLGAATGISITILALRKNRA